MHRSFSVIVACGLLGAACGKSSDTTSAASGATSATAVSQPSKMAQQAHSSAQYQSDTSETATTGSTSGTSNTASKRQSGSTSASGSATVEGSRGGSANEQSEGTIEFHGGMDFNQVIAGNFNVAFALSGHHNGCSHDTGNVSCDVQYKGPNNFDANIMFDVNQTLNNGNILHIFTDPIITVSRTGSRTSGTINRTINGTERRTRDALDASGNMVAADASSVFDFTIDHTDTVVVDTYASGNLTTRTISGNVTITDNTDNTSAVVTFSDVVRTKPDVCLCPSGGSIDVVYTVSGQATEHKYTFGSTCGSVVVTGDASAASSTTISNGNNTASTTTTASATTTETWPMCVPTTSN